MKPGDRVAVYQFGMRYTGTIKEVTSPDRLLVLLDGATSSMRAHPKQCRLLKKKAPRRRVWVKFDVHGDLAGCWPDDTSRPFNAIEFLEVRKCK